MKSVTLEIAPNDQAGTTTLQYLFIAVAILAVAAFAPLKFTLSLFVCALVIGMVVKITAGKVSGPVSFTDAAKSVAWAFSLLILAVGGLLLATQGQLRFEGLAAVALIAGLFVAFVLGFKIALQTTFGAGAVIAVVSTVISALLLFVLRPVLF